MKRITPDFRLLAIQAFPLLISGGLIEAVCVSVQIYSLELFPLLISGGLIEAYPPATTQARIQPISAAN